MQHRILHILFIICLLASCSARKFVPQNEQLYVKPKVDFVLAKKIMAKGNLETEISDILRPEPVTSFLGMRPSLWIWYKYSKPNEHPDSGSWAKRKLGKEPVYFSQANPEVIVSAINASLYNNGFFDSKCTYEPQLNEKKKTATYIYTIKLNEPYRIKEVEWPKDTSEVWQAIKADTNNTILKPRRRYNLNRLVEERNRISNNLKEKGYFFFSDKDINYKMDTTLGNRQVKLSLYLKKETPESHLNPYIIRKVNVYTNYSIVADTAPYEVKVIDSTHFYERYNYIRLMPIKRAIFLSEGRLYSRQDHNLTLSRLSDIGIFKFVNVKFDASDSLLGFLDATIQLAPKQRKSITAELTGASKSNNFLGPAFSVRFRNRNAFKGAELLVVNASTSLETQFNGPFKGQYTYELNPSMELYVPRFFLPKRLINTKSNFVPKTKFILDYSYTSRVNYFNMQSGRFSYGYKWKPNLELDHDLGLFNLTYFNVYKESQAFQELLGNNLFLKRRFEKQFIEGITYTFMYNQQVKPQIRNPIYLGINAEIAGSLLSLLDIGQKRVNNEPHQILGVNYAQFARLEVEWRKYFRLDNRNRRYIATRVLTGWGLPFGNSTTMPYIRQFFSGGAYSVRGFPSFSLGPGTYHPPDSLRSGFYLQQGGEIKLEANIEYRYTITSFLKGAFFADAGNTWLNNPNAELPGAEFRVKDFYKETAVSVGLGIRLDIQFFVLRLDLGMPVRKPWYNEGERWRFDAIDFGNSSWRRDNLILNLAFGYPF